MGEREMFKDVVIDMFDALTWNALRLPTFVKGAKPKFITYSPHVGAFHFCVMFKSEYHGKRDVFLRELFGAPVLQIRNGYMKSSKYKNREHAAPYPFRGICIFRLFPAYFPLITSCCL